MERLRVRSLVAFEIDLKLANIACVREANRPPIPQNIPRRHAAPVFSVKERRKRRLHYTERMLSDVLEALSPV